MLDSVYHGKTRLARSLSHVSCLCHALFIIFILISFHSQRANFGHVTFYIRESCDDSPRSRYTKKQFPYARQNPQQTCKQNLYSHSHFSIVSNLVSFGSLVRVSKWTPIYVDRYTRHTFIRTLYGSKIISSNHSIYFNNLLQFMSYHR